MCTRDVNHDVARRRDLIYRFHSALSISHTQCHVLRFQKMQIQKVLFKFGIYHQCDESQALALMYWAYFSGINSKKTVIKSCTKILTNRRLHKIFH